MKKIREPKFFQHLQHFFYDLIFYFLCHAAHVGIVRIEGRAIKIGARDDKCACAYPFPQAQNIRPLTFFDKESDAR